MFAPIPTHLSAAFEIRTLQEFLISSHRGRENREISGLMAEIASSNYHALFYEKILSIGNFFYY